MASQSQTESSSFLIPSAASGWNSAAVCKLEKGWIQNSPDKMTMDDGYDSITLRLKTQAVYEHKTHPQHLTHTHLSHLNLV